MESDVGVDARSQVADSREVANGIETVSVDEGGGVGDAEDSRFGVTRLNRYHYKLHTAKNKHGKRTYLGFWCDATNFYITES